MEDKILGIHHVTAIAGKAQRNYDFYTQVMGQRLVKKTVNFDDPKTYHFYYGDERGTPGTVLSFFPWEDIMNGRRGTHMATEVGYSIPAGSIDFWVKRLEAAHMLYNKPSQQFGELYIPFIDPSGMKVELTVPAEEDVRVPFGGGEVEAAYAIRGLHHVTLTVEDVQPTADVLVSLLGYELKLHHANRYRFFNPADVHNGYVDVVEAKGEPRGHIAGGSIHHVAFRVANGAAQLRFRERAEQMGLQVTEQLDRKYFQSVYFREPGGVLLELATDGPGFAVDEPLAALGTQLMLPLQYDSQRVEIEGHLSPIQQTAR